MRTITTSFRLECTQGQTFLRSRGQNFALGEFDCTIDGATLTAETTGPFPSLDAANRELERRLTAWALELELDKGWRLDFQPTGSYAVDAETGRGTGSRFVRVGTALSFSGNLNREVQTLFPMPHGGYRENERIRLRLARLRDLREGREKAPAAAYALLTELETVFGGGSRARAASALSVNKDLLHRVGKLSSGYHPTAGRKVSNGSRELTDADLAWLDAAVAVLVRRAVAVESGVRDLPPLTVTDVA